MDHILCALIYFIVFLSRFSKLLSRFGIGSYEEWAPGRRMKILLVGYNGARNTGSDVRTAAIAAQVRALFGAGQAQITVMTLDAASLEGYFDEDIVLLPFSSFFPWHLYRACCRHHAVILCEGSTLKSTFANALTLFECEAAGIMAAQGKPCIANGSEIGYMEPFLARAASRLCRETYFITRNRKSLHILTRLGLRGHAGTDAAWTYDRAIPDAEAERLLRGQGWDGKQSLLGIAVINPFCWPVRASLRKWLRSILTRDFSGQYDKWYYFSDSPFRRMAYEQYIREIAKGTRAYLREHRCFPVLIGMERLDEKACRALKAQLHVPCAMFLSGGCSAPVMTGILEKLSMLVTSRYHAAVLSMRKACPIVAVSMDERLDNVMHELSLDRNYLFHVTDKELGTEVFRALSEAQSDRKQICSHITVMVPKYRAKLGEMGRFLYRYLRNAFRNRFENSAAGE